MPVYKYKDKLKLVKNCPPQEFKNLKFEAFRLVKNDPPVEQDFLPCAICQPARVFPNGEQKCSSLGLSFFVSAEALTDKFSRLRRNMPNFSKIFGEKIAKGVIQYNHGVMRAPNGEGHFTFHEYGGSELHKEFKVIGDFAAELKAG